MRLVFDAALVPYIRERPWHASLNLRDLPGGGCEATLRLNSLVDVRRRILACGRQVEVLAPAELRATIASEAAALAARHAWMLSLLTTYSPGHPLSPSRGKLARPYHMKQP